MIRATASRRPPAPCTTRWRAGRGPEILTVDGFVGLLDESALWMVDAILAGAEDYGCTPDQAVYAFRSIWFYMVGEILVRAHSVREGAPEAAAGRASSSGLDPSRCRAWPRSARAGPRSPPAMPTIRGCARSSMVC
ncbi:hypothetical protein ACWDNI_00240 [Nocardia niigatensis]